MMTMTSYGLKQLASACVLEAGFRAFWGNEYERIKDWDNYRAIRLTAWAVNNAERDIEVRRGAQV
jgi:hypothetical protein